jgi:hypothetical protein
MKNKKALLRISFADAKDRALIVYRKTRIRDGAERSGAFALGRYDGFKEALRLLDGQGGSDRRARSAEARRPRMSPRAIPVFSEIFQKLRPKHGPSTLGRW